ncbi:hypothetical protein Cni_G04686 [Canna indica]|uniref:BHLH domain-containing protein n=1 Tax=Canna indica TaxID=4628 RepID=A0AAQ3Q4Q7_9LILI|nr:hypothetical protein Cni_G04686 [Canna indica]
MAPTVIAQLMSKKTYLPFNKNLDWALFLPVALVSTLLIAITASESAGNMQETNEVPWTLDKLNDFRMSSLIQLPNQARAAPVPESGKSSVSQHIFSSQVHYMQICSSHVSHLSSDILSPGPRPLRAIPAGDIPEGYVLPNSRMDSAKSYCTSGTSSALHHMKFSEHLLHPPSNSSVNEVSPAKVNTHVPILNNMNAESTSNFDKALIIFQNDDVSINSMVPRSHTSKEGNSDGGREKAVVTCSREKSHSREARDRAAISNRLRRARIAEAIKALGNSIPFSDQGNKDTVLDDAIDYIKFLKLQLKVLSQNRLNGESPNYPFVYVEGYGHYLFHEQFSGEPLEEMMGQLIESDMQAASDLLGSKGLNILPIDLARTLFQTD